MIRVLIGDIFESKAQTLVNTVNCVGVMGKGVALEFKKRFPDMVKDYKQHCDKKKLKPGVPYLYSDLFGTSIINFPTKDHWRSASRLEDIQRGLDIFADQYKSWGVQSIAFPPLGCGNGGLGWQVVGPLMYQKLTLLDVDVELYAPYGTSHELLKPEFLIKQNVTNHNMKGTIQEKLKKEWVAVLEVIDRLSKEKYASPVGRTIFQKICYVMTEQGIDTGFRFRQGSYGPYSEEVKKALMVFSNSNLVQEKEYGKMTRLVMTPEYENVCRKYSGYLRQVEQKISKAVDLFSRIRDTNQAEEVSTVFYSIRKLKERKADVSEKDIFDFVLSWKKKWNTPEKKKAVASAIRNLVMLRWVSADFSSNLIDEEALYI